MENDLYKIRSLGSCLKSAYDIFSTNLKHIFHRTWIPALTLSIISSILSIVLINFSSYFTTAPSKATVVFFIGVLILILLSYSAYAWFYTIIISLLNGESVKNNLPRIIRLVVLVLCLCIGITLIVAGVSLSPLIGAKNPAAIVKASATSSLIFGALMVIVAIITLPLSYSMMKYAIETKSKLFSVFKRPYIIGWRHWGYLFMACMLSGIIVAVIYFVASLPLTITTIASQLNNWGQAMGDPSGLPGYFYILFFLAGLIASFIMAYAMTWFTCVVYYAYGHIEAKEKAKKEILPQAEDARSPKTDPTNEPDFEEIK